MQPLNDLIALETKFADVADIAVGIDHWGFSAANLAKAKRAVISCRTNGIQYTYDGTAVPTATDGHPILKDYPPTILDGNDCVNNLKAIIDVASSSSSPDSSSSSSPAASLVTARVTITLEGFSR